MFFSCALRSCMASVKNRRENDKKIKYVFVFLSSPNTNKIADKIYLTRFYLGNHWSYSESYFIPFYNYIPALTGSWLHSAFLASVTEDTLLSNTVIFDGIKPLEKKTRILACFLWCSLIAFITCHVTSLTLFDHYFSLAFLP